MSDHNAGEFGRPVEENRRFKQMSADPLLENRALKDAIAKALKPAAKRALVVVLQKSMASERRACVAVGLQRSDYHYQPRPTAMAQSNCCWIWLGNDWSKSLASCSGVCGGWATVGPRVYRIYCALKLNKDEEAKHAKDWRSKWTLTCRHGALCACSIV